MDHYYVKSIRLTLKSFDDLKSKTIKSIHNATLKIPLKSSTVTLRRLKLINYPLLFHPSWTKKGYRMTWLVSGPGCTDPFKQLNSRYTCFMNAGWKPRGWIRGTCTIVFFMYSKRLKCCWQKNTFLVQSPMKRSNMRFEYKSNLGDFDVKNLHLSLICVKNVWVWRHRCKWNLDQDCKIHLYGHSFVSY